MSHLSDNDLDRLAREAAEHLDVDQNSSGWDALEKRLDEEMPVEKKRRRWLFFLLFPLVGAILFFGYRQFGARHDDQPEIARSEKPASNSPGPGSEGAMPREPQEASNEIDSRINKRPATPATDTNRPTGGQSDSSPSSSAVEQGNADLKRTPSTENQSGSSAGSGTRASSVTDSEINKRKKVSGNPPLVRNTSRRTTKSNKSASGQPVPQIAITESGGDMRDHRSGKKEPATPSTGTGNSTTATESMESNNSTPIANPLPGDSAAATNAIIASSDTATMAVQHSPAVDSTKASPAKPTARDKRKTLMPQRGFVLGIHAGPDVSEVNRKGVDRTGINLGVQVGYRISGQISVLSGLTYTHKFYTAHGADYFPPKPSGTFLDYVTLTKVIGDCFMYELPVNVRFDALATRKNYLYTSVGLSSYFMKKENYDFHYTDNMTGSYGSKYLSYNSKLKNWFKVLNLSVGYERMLNKRLSVQAEPYMKLPLEGLAFGRMKLSSYGLFLGVHYHAGTMKIR